MAETTPVERRDFIRQACGLCASVLGIAALLPAVSACSPLKTITGQVNQGMIDVLLSNFTPESNMVIVRNNDFDFDLAVVKFPDGNYKAFQLQCTHRANPLVVTKTGFFCNLHGSRYALDGTVTQAPATSNLREYNFQVSADKISIKI